MTRLIIPVLASLALGAHPALAQIEQHSKPRDALPLNAITGKWTGDLDGMTERRMIRVLTVYSKTVYFVDKGTERGLTHDALKVFEDELNKKLNTKRFRVNVVFVPVSRDELLPALTEGRGDLAAANLTITPERLREVDFTDPVYSGVSEIVITGPHSPRIATLDDLAGKDIFVRKSSSYYESLTKLNDTFKREHKQAITLTPAPEVLEDEDLLEMLNAGLVQILVVDSHKAKFWGQVFPELTLHTDLAVRSRGEIGYAVRKTSPKLKAALNEFIKKTGEHSAVGREIFRRYLQSTRYVQNATADAELKKFHEVIAYFRKYGDRYSLDWLLLAAQGYQESRLDQSVKSHVGAIGVMQVMPATGRAMSVGDITEVDPNIHAGVKYVRFMVDQYYKNEPMDDLNKGLFAFAAYNAGPGRVASLRKEAARRGLDPNVWFNNVERVAAEIIGRETVTYVSNIYKYYVAYTLVQGEYLQRMEARKQFLPASK